MAIKTVEYRELASRKTGYGNVCIGITIDVTTPDYEGALDAAKAIVKEQLAIEISKGDVEYNSQELKALQQMVAAEAAKLEKIKEKVRKTQKLLEVD